MEIGGLQKLSLIDYPEKLACVVFLIGCNFRCPFCHNSSLVLSEKIKKQPRISENYFFNFLKRRKKFLEGVVLSGGEPTIWNDLPNFIKKIKNLGYLVKLDTNGYNPEMLRRLIAQKLINYVAIDIKAPLELDFQINSNFQFSKYDKITGIKVDIKKIKKSIEIIKNSKIDYEFRTTIIPTLLRKEDIIQITKKISPAKRYFLQNFRPENTLDLKFEKIKPYSQKYLSEIQKIISPFFEVCRIR